MTFVDVETGEYDRKNALRYITHGQSNDADGSSDRTDGSLLGHLCLSCDAVLLVTAGFADRASSVVWVEVILPHNCKAAQQGRASDPQFDF
jgi:hypothetical protein